MKNDQMICWKQSSLFIAFVWMEIYMKYVVVYLYKLISSAYWLLIDHTFLFVFSFELYFRAKKPKSTNHLSSMKGCLPLFHIEERLWEIEVRQWKRIKYQIKNGMVKGRMCIMTIDHDTDNEWIKKKSDKRARNQVNTSWLIGKE